MIKIKNLIIIAVFTTANMGCSNTAPKEYHLNQLTRVDVQIFSGENINNEIIITEEEKIRTFKEVLEKIDWEQNVKAEMDGKEDIKATLFFKFDRNMPERLFEYLIWFNEGASSTIIDREKHALGTLDKEDTQTLKDILLND
ncbi:hypothetical protein [Lederbergia citri]|uniref:Uncharacterized protein n=1 Tax=Lederbergia citri TaxID=2833580 RepID=A0A942TE89_9BACI|nr:hypothetical protein [Lederbergia citri]MBS4195208.1 hypothetical protein [Lederbergia citri]